MDKDEKIAKFKESLGKKLKETMIAYGMDDLDTARALRQMSITMEDGSLGKTLERLREMFFEDGTCPECEDTGITATNETGWDGDPKEIECPVCRGTRLRAAYDAHPPDEEGVFVTRGDGPRERVPQFPDGRFVTPMGEYLPALVDTDSVKITKNGKEYPPWKVPRESMTITPVDEHGVKLSGRQGQNITVEGIVILRGGGKISTVIADGDDEEESG